MSSKTKRHVRGMTRHVAGTRRSYYHEATAAWLRVNIYRWGSLADVNI